MSTPTILPVKKRVRRKRKNTATTTTPVALTLLSALYDMGTSVQLAFDRPISIEHLIVSTIVVADGEQSPGRWIGDGEAALVDPQTVQIALVREGISPEPGILLDAGSDNGICAAYDAAVWAGVSDYPVRTP